MRRTRSPRQRNAFAPAAWAGEQRLGSPGFQAVILLLANYSDENLSCFPGQALLAEQSQQSKRTVMRQLEKLEAWGLIRRERRVNTRGHRTSDRYYLDIDLVIDVHADPTPHDDPEPTPPSPDEGPETVVVPDSDEASDVNEGLGDNLSPRDSGGPKCQDLSPRTAALGDKSAALGDNHDTSKVTPGVTGTTSRTTQQGTTSDDVREQEPSADAAVTTPAGAGSPTKEQSPRRPKAKLTSLPEDFELTPGMRNWAATNTPSLDVDFEFEAFKDRVLAKGDRYVDWNRAWMTSMRNQERWNAGRAGGTRRPGTPARRSYDDAGTWGTPAEEQQHLPTGFEPQQPLDPEEFFGTRGEH